MNDKQIKFKSFNKIVGKSNDQEKKLELSKSSSKTGDDDFKE